MNTERVSLAPVAAWAAVAALGLWPGLDSRAQVADTGIAVFDDSFLHRPNGQPLADLSVFAFSNRVLPGRKAVMLYLNGQNLGVRDFDFLAAPGNEDAQPCFHAAALRDLGVKVQAFPELQQAGDDTRCLDTLSVIPSAQASYDPDQNVLKLSIPQAALDRKARGLVPPELWDTGTTAFWSSYRLSYNHTRTSGEWGASSHHTTFSSFRNGLNVGAWRLRANGTYHESDYRSSWDWSDLYVERDIAAWRGWLRIGDSATPGNIFSSTRFRGVQIKSDDGMLPDSQRGYAPVVRGVASGNAKVTVRQNGHIIYTTFVSAGPFVIDDLYSTPGGGDLEVVVDEIGGRTTRFFQPFSALPAMMREGIWNYNFMVGEHRHNYDADRPLMGQATLAYGLPYGLTAYGGFIGAQRGYYAGALGLAANLREMGAASVDVTSSRSQDARGATLVGTAARIQYAKSFPGSGTDFTLASYRYSSNGYRSLDDSVRDHAYSGAYQGLDRLHEYQLAMSQRLGARGSLSVNYYGIAYRNAPRDATYANLSYSSSIGRVGYAVNYGINRNPWQRRESTLMLTLSIPLGGAHNISYSVNRTSHQGVNHNANLSGAFLDDYSLTYALQTGLTHGAGRDDGSQGFAALGYASPVGLANISHGYSKNSSNTHLEFSGAFLVDGKGPLLGQSIGETAIIVEAPGARDVAVEAYPGVRTNAAGRALIPYASPYRENRVSLAQEPGAQGAHLNQSVQTVVPTRGAIVVAKFDTEAGRTLLVLLRNPAREDLPFGAAIHDADGKQRGIVGPIGRAWLTGLQGVNRYTVKWGPLQEQQCAFEITVNTDTGVAERTGKELICAK
ncbi:fimbria/pilus outer membrane usher protein [Bordetella petrii]|uniref:fimbria/pilus outer membrane usher protein n=1 Tax=Bordetella petrii TaxID=94624 RepID=UPI001E5BC32F|nr:fimbria/pilus outer membrane usher protein [Bordetella petrii]MCD0502868.1 fimbrial biogenesis outer membrane usher protein [Bordetella petrii]